jgi:hypothetical protein
MRTSICLLAAVLATTTTLSIVAAGNDQWVDGTVSYTISGLYDKFSDPAAACKAGVDDLAKHGNHKTYVSVKEGTSSTYMTCVLKEADGSIFEQANSVSKQLDCPATTSPRSTDNSGDFAKERCHCDDAKKGCPVVAKPPAKKP